jgi:hypothetical protein
VVSEVRGALNAADVNRPPVEAPIQAMLLRDIIINPTGLRRMCPTWLAVNGRVVERLAREVYQENSFDLLPILADALEDAGCEDPDILAHCRCEGLHTRGCWVIDLLLSKE